MTKHFLVMLDGLPVVLLDLGEIDTICIAEWVIGWGAHSVDGCHANTNMLELGLGRSKELVPRRRRWQRHAQLAGCKHDGCRCDGFRTKSQTVDRRLKVIDIVPRGLLDDELQMQTDHGIDTDLCKHLSSIQSLDVGQEELVWVGRVHHEPERG